MADTWPSALFLGGSRAGGTQRLASQVCAGGRPSLVEWGDCCGHPGVFTTLQELDAVLTKAWELRTSR